MDIISGTLTPANLDIEQVNQQQVSTFLTAGNIKFMLLHGGKSDESIRNFFQDVYELYVKVRYDLLRRSWTELSSWDACSPSYLVAYQLVFHLLNSSLILILL